MAEKDLLEVETRRQDGRGRPTKIYTVVKHHQTISRSVGDRVRYIDSQDTGTVSAKVDNGYTVVWDVLTGGIEDNDTYLGRQLVTSID